MNIAKSSTNTIINLGLVAIVILLLSLFLLSIVALEGSLAPILLFFLMVAFAYVLIAVFSNNDEISLKIKLFVFSFSAILVYTLVNHYVLVSYFPEMLPYMYVDGITFYTFSNFVVPYISGEKNFFDLFSVYQIHELPLHLVFSGTIAYFSNLIDGNNTVIIQKMLSPFFGGIFSTVLYSTLKYQFKDTYFAVNATFAYTLLSAVFIYSTSLMRDIDIALAYMIFIYIFLQPSSYKNFFLLVLVAFLTTYIRSESGLVLFSLSLLYVFSYARNIQSISVKAIFYMIIILFSLFVILLMFNKIIGMIMHLEEAKIMRSTAQASAGSIGVLLNKLPFGVSHIAKMLFGQIQPFPFFLAIDRPPEAISGIFWPFIFIMMLYALMKKNIRVLIDIKVKYLLMVAIAILFLMSAEPMARRMMSVYPIMYITSLYAFLIVPKNEIKRIFSYYIFGMISLNIFYYLIKI